MQTSYNQPHLLSCGAYITKINLDFYFQPMSQLVFVSLFIKFRSYLKCAFKCKLKKSVIARMDIRSLGHALPRQGRSQPFGTDLFWGRPAKLSHAEGLNLAVPPLLCHERVFVPKLLAWNLRRHVPFHVLYILFIHFFNFEMTKAQVYGFPLHSILQVCIFYKEYYAVSLLPLSHKITD